MHFFGEDISNVPLARNVDNFNRFFLNKFANRIFTKLNVMCCLGGHIIRSLDTSVIIFVKHRWGQSVLERETSVRN